MIINLTPHAVKVSGKEFPSSGIVARCNEVTSPVCMIDGIEIVNKSFGKVENLPEQKSDTYYIVSMLVRQALPGRLDLLSPGDLIRDEAGQIVGCKNFASNAVEVGGSSEGIKEILFQFIDGGKLYYATRDSVYDSLLKVDKSYTTVYTTGYGGDGSSGEKVVIEKCGVKKFSWSKAF